MTALDLPAEVPGFRHLDCQPSAATTVGTYFRSVAAEVQNVHEWAARGAAPARWRGSAATAAHHARTRFTGRVGIAQEALQLATVATTRFEDRLVHLKHRRKRLEEDRRELNLDVAETRMQARAHSVEESVLHHRAARLRHRAETLVADITAWETDLDNAEAQYIVALAHIDTVPEATDVAGTVRLPDASALLGQLRGLCGDVAAVAAWWSTLTRAQRQALMVADPSVIGATDGLPITARDRANRAFITQQRDYLDQRRQDGQLSYDEQAALDSLDRVQDKIDEYADDVNPSSGRPLLRIIKFDPYAYGGDGSAILSLGNPDFAENVAGYVPGVTSEGGKLSGLTQVETLYDQMSQKGTAATILYDDYDAPSGSLSGIVDHVVHNPMDALDGDLLDGDLGDYAQALSPDDAVTGGHRLAHFLDGLDSSDRGTEANSTMIGHSYGSVVAAYSAKDGGDMDNLLLVADPGAPGQNVHDLVGDSGVHVYVAADDHDPISLVGTGPRGGLGLLGTDPAAASYGADRIAVDSGPADISSWGDNHAAKHYFSGEGLKDITAVTTGGRPDLVDGRTDDNYESLDELLGHGAADQGLGSVGDYLWTHGGQQAYDGGKTVIEAQASAVKGMYDMANDVPVIGGLLPGS